MNVNSHELVTPEPSGPPPTRPPGWGGVIVVGTVLYAIAYIVWERSGWGSQQLRDFIGNAAFMPLNLTVVTLFALASRNLALDPAVRRALRLLALASVLVLIGNAISIYYGTVLDTNPPVSWADPFYLGNNLLTLIGLLSFPLARRTPHEWRKFALDAATVLVGGAVLNWYFVVRPMLASGQSDVNVLALAFAYPLASMLVLLGITTVLLRRPSDGNRRAFGLLVTASLVGIIADLIFNFELVDLGRRTAVWTDAIYLLMYVLLIASGSLYLRHPVPGAPRPETGLTPSQPLSPLPYLAALIVYALLLDGALRQWIDPISGVALGAAVITVLVLIRQFLAVRQNVRLLAETAARQNEARFRSLVQHSSDVIFVIQPAATVRFVSPSVWRVFGYDPSHLIGARLSEFVHPEDLNEVQGFLSDAASRKGVTQPSEWRVRRPDGSWLHAETIGTNLLDDPAVAGIVLNARDVSERKLLEQQLTHQAFHDPLTGLANRALFRDRVSHALTLASRQGGSLAVLFLDLDDFKKVNDSLGHSEGDRLLVEASKRLRASARESDTVARLGGDEFAVLIEDVEQEESREAVVERIAGALESPFVLSGTEIRIHASTGVATAGRGDTADALLRMADVAMYAAKRQGKGRHVDFDPRMYTDVVDRLEMEKDLRLAIDRGELQLFYQPIVALDTGHITGVEALVRWEHPRLGVLVPLHFIPLAEETGLIVPLGQWVLRQATTQIQRWRTDFPARNLMIYINISGRELHEPEAVAKIGHTITSAVEDPGAIVLEITESVLMQQTEQVLAKLHEIKRLGVQLAIDDFGTGYSSLSYLQRFPFDILKIAKPFVDDVAAGVERSALARAIIGIGDTLKLRTLAEGIEIAEQRVGLLELGCEMGQGYFFARPLRASGIEAILRNPGEPVKQNRSSGANALPSVRLPETK
jgi:diguanylate cyclase (GGDEF)-like protein/PAS domain S-box-containing protein